MKKLTTIQLSLETRDRLKAAASKNETYDDFLNRLLDVFEAK